MKVSLSFSSLSNSRWYEYVVRFLLGGVATVFTGLVSQQFGPAVGGMFLAMPAIFCASATLIERHEIRRKREAGLEGHRRGQAAAALDSAGAVLGSLAMMLFAATILTLAPSGPVVAFLGSLAVWTIAAVALWNLRLKYRAHQRRG